MNRVEMIAKLAKKGTGAGVTKPKGLHCAATGKQPTKERPRDRKRTSGVFAHGSWGPINRTIAHRFDWLKERDEPAEKKAGGRHGAHPLTRIAEKLKRSWH